MEPHGCSVRHHFAAPMIPCTARNNDVMPNRATKLRTHYVWMAARDCFLIPLINVQKVASRKPMNNGPRGILGLWERRGVRGEFKGPIFTKKIPVFVKRWWLVALFFFLGLCAWSQGPLRNLRRERHCFMHVSVFRHQKSCQPFHS